MPPKVINLLRDSNNKNLTINIITSFIVKGGSLIVALFTMPSFMRYFKDSDVLGVWFTMLSVLSWILSFDFGLGNGLRNQLVVALVEKNVVKQKKLISSAYLSIGAIAVLIFSVFLIFVRLISWNKVFNINQNLISSNLLMKTVIVCVVGVVLQFSLRLISSISYALQYSFLPGLLALISTTSTLIAVNIFIFLGHENDLLLVAWAYVFCVNIPLIAATFIVFATKLKKMVPSISCFDFKISVSIYKLGLVFFWLQLMSLIINSTNDFLISLFVGPSQDVPYQVYAKIFTLVSGILTLALVPVWSAVAKAKAENRYNWIRKIYILLLSMLVLVFFVYLLMLPFLQQIFDLWLGNNTISVNYNFALVFVIFGTINLWSGILATLVNGLGDLKIQIVFLTLGAIINIPLAYLFVQISGGFISVVAANIISLLPFCIVQTIALFKKFKAEPQNIL